MVQRQTLYADILLPLPLKASFTYRVPFALSGSIATGKRVVVPFGRNKVYSGLVKKIHKTPPEGFSARYIHSVLDDRPVVTPAQFAFWDWIASYYMCTQGEVMNAALPPAMKLAGETRVSLNPGVNIPEGVLGKNEKELVDALGEKPLMSISEASKSISVSNVFPVIKALMEKGLIVMKEDLDNPWKPKKSTYVSLSEDYSDEEKLREVFEYCEKKAPRQLELLMAFFRHSDEKDDIKAREVSAVKLTGSLKGGASALKTLVGKGVLKTSEREESYFSHLNAVDRKADLNPEQVEALKEIRHGFSKKDVVLLHGVTSSGKTELYIKLIRDTIRQGRQVLYLLPEIALTAQIISRLQSTFGSNAGIYHSRFNPLERSEVWNNLLMGGIASGSSNIKYDLVLGPRSAVFLPFRDLGLVIIDEEHEPSFKQQDPAPRYHARDAAIYLASMHGAKVVLGSATPSLEAYSRAKAGKFGYASIDKRHGGVQMPQVLVADLRKESRSKSMKSHFSPLLFESIGKALEQGEQVILFQNRRGFSPRLECEVCHWLPGCHQCDVSLVYHKKINKLKCHYCGSTTAPPAECPSCGSTDIRMKGFGTEKIEEEIPLFFPDAVVSRMDLDTTRSKNSYRRIIDDFEKRRIDILVGTQMISKGLDFDNVGVVGILNADNMLNFPDFRSHERAFQLMAQVSGRAGRSNKRGKVIIQTYRPEHPVIKQVVENDYESMYRCQTAERKQFNYPPFSRLVMISMLHGNEKLLNDASCNMAEKLRKVFPGNVLGPEYPVVARVRKLYIKNILVKFLPGPQLARKKEKLERLASEERKGSELKGVRLVFNVDPA